LTLALEIWQIILFLYCKVSCKQLKLSSVDNNCIAFQLLTAVYKMVKQIQENLSTYKSILPYAEVDLLCNYCKFYEYITQLQ